jgi:ABC-2 type transport system permease protein
MKNKLWFLTKYSLDKKIKSKWFIIANVLLLVLIASLTNIDKIISSFGGNFNQAAIVEVIDETNKAYPMFEGEMNKQKKQLGMISKYEVKKFTGNEKEEEEKIKKSKNILVIIRNSDTNYIDAKVLAKNYSNQILYQVIVSSLNNTKAAIALSMSNISLDELNKIYSPITIEQVTLGVNKDDNMNLVMGTVFPLVILPFFMLVIFIIQMIGLEINEEKTTKGMEIIISNVSAETHFFSKIIAANTFVIMQGLLLFSYAMIGLLIRNVGGSASLVGSVGLDIKDLLHQVVSTGITDKLLYIAPLTLILFLLSFLVYSLLAGIFSSITVNIEDYQQIQTPIILLLLSGYYLSILAGLFEGSLFIRILSYIPFFSALLSPALLILGQITVYDVLISIVLLLLTVYFIIKYGIKIYKVGILNYSSEKLWGRFAKVVKNRDKI